MISKKVIVLKPQKERALLNRHPWIFSGAVARFDKNLAVGDEVLVQDSAGHPMAHAHWCGEKGLVCRVITFIADLEINDQFWIERLIGAKLLRQSLALPSSTTNGFRFLHGEGDNISGLVCDIFADTASIQLSNPGLKPVVKVLGRFLEENYSIKNIHVEDSSFKEKYWLIGQSQPCKFRENNHQFSANVGDGQKTGYFLDQRDNRLLVKSLCQGRDVLDAFCYSGGFSVYALAGQARSVTSVDISLAALKLAEENAHLNGFEQSHTLIQADCFHYLRSIKKDEFDCIILDPPAFAKTADAVLRASRGYKDINLLALKAIRQNGIIFTFSCSQHIDMELFKKIIFAAAKDSKREVKIIKELSQSLDHPVSVFCPQSSYLKGLALYVE